MRFESLYNDKNEVDPLSNNKGESLFNPDQQLDVANGVEKNSSFDPDKRLDVHQESFDNSVESFDPDKRIEIPGPPYTTRDERISCTPIKECSYGEWQGDRGDSKFIPYDANVKEKLSAFGLDGIEYKNGIVDFSKCADTTVKIDMTSERYSKPNGDTRIVGNFEKADKKCAEIWNEQAREGRTDWDKNSVKKWRIDNNHTWHECSDTETCQLVPREIHDVCLHPGGIMECKKRDTEIAFGGGFDEYDTN